jgi:hypothetical protein
MRYGLHGGKASFKDIADVLSVPESAVRSLVTNGVRKLRKDVAKKKWWVTSGASSDASYDTERFESALLRDRITAILSEYEGRELKEVQPVSSTPV